MVDILEILPYLIMIILAYFTYKQNISIKKLEHEQKKGEFVHRLQFETEFQAYKEIWGKLTYLKEKAISLRYPYSKEKEDEKLLIDLQKKSKIEKFKHAYNECQTTYENNKPFYPAGIYNLLQVVIRSSIIEQMEYILREASPKSSKERNKNIDKLLSNMDDVCEAIRKRIGVIKIKD